MKSLSQYDNIVESKGVTKKFGFKTVLKGIDLELKTGNFLALFGPNGAGKTTLIKILCSLMLPSSGKVSIAGFDPRSDREALCQVVGVVSHHTFLYNNLSAIENLKFYGTMYGVMGLDEKIEKLIGLVGLAGLDTWYQDRILESRVQDNGISGANEATCLRLQGRDGFNPRPND